MDMVASPDETMPSSSFANTHEPIESTASTDFSTQSKDEFEMKSEQPPSIAAPTSTPALIPSLKGVMTYAGGMVTCKGKWAMSDSAHEIEGQTSEFEFKLVKADQDSAFFPINGKYQGFFLIKQAPPLKGSIKVEDKEMMMKFIPNEDSSGHTISGDGYNKLGKFTLRGSLSEDGRVHLYREYYQFFAPAPVATPKKAPVLKKETSADKKQKVGSEGIPAPPVESATPREGGQRIRKQSSYLKEFHDPLQKPIPRSISKDSVTPRINTVNTPLTNQAIAASSSAVERSHRLSPGMKKCSDLLKELCKLHQAQWFLEPVDPIKYNIPDYPKIIKTPMDFSTIRSKIENNLYDSINAFAEDMRLVFRNAVTYNQARESLVNIAAREISSKFEDKFRILVTQLDPAAMSFAAAAATPRGGGGGLLKRSKSKDFNGIMRTVSSSSIYNRPGPRPFQSQFALPPAAMDGSTMKIMEMQTIIQNMQDELKQLRTVVKESEIGKKLTESKEAAQNPLSFDEKKTLVGQISKLAPDKMERVLAIIQEAMPEAAEGMAEVPLDSLDTLTLRRLQQFVASNVPEKKKRAYNIRTDGANKRPRKSRVQKGATGMEGGQLPGDDHSQDFGGFGAGDDDELLFEAETFDDLEGMPVDGSADPDDYAREVLAEYEKLKSQGNVFVKDEDHQMSLDSPHDGVTSSGNDVEEDEDDDNNLWSAAAAEVQNKKQAHYDDDHENVYSV